MKKTIAILALFILFSSIFVYAQTAQSAAEVVKRCLDSGKTRDECMSECLQYAGTDECERLLPKPNIFRRIADAFKPADTTTQTEDCCCAVENNYFLMNSKACTERKGRCTDLARCKQQPVTGRPATCEMKLPDPVNPARDTAGCEDCAASVCFNMFHQEFLCLEGYTRCAEKHAFCRPIFCEPAKPECGSCPGCPPCEQPKECCCQPYNQIMADDVCNARQGRCADVSACKEQERVCCSFPMPTATTYAPTPVPPQMLTADICKEKGGTPVEAKYCESTPKDCCCEPYKQIMTEDVCKARQGRCTDVALCTATKECCCQPFNQIMKEDACKARQGRCDAVEACKEVPNTERTCCQYGDKFEYSTVDDCRKTQGLRTDLKNCEITCCKYATPTTVTAYVPPKAPETIPYGTCQKNGGTPVTMSYCEMPTAQTTPPATISTNVCCEVRTGYYQMTPKDQCKIVVADSYCTPKLTAITQPLTQVSTRTLYTK